MQFSKSALQWAYLDAVEAGDHALAKAIQVKLKAAGVGVEKSARVPWISGPKKHWAKR